MNFEPAGPLRTSANLGQRRRGEPRLPTRGLRDAQRPRRGAARAHEPPAPRPARLRARPRRHGLVRAGARRRGDRDARAASPRSIARRHGLDLVDLEEHRPSPDAIEQVPLRTLERVVALPLSRRGDRLLGRRRRPRRTSTGSTSSSSPRATRSTSSSPPRDEILAELERYARQNEVIASQSALDEITFEALDVEEALEQDDGVSDAPLVRLVNSIIMQAAGDGASDIHFEPQEESRHRPHARRRRALRSSSASRSGWPPG